MRYGIKSEEKRVLVELEQDGNDVNINVDGELVAWFDSSRKEVTLMIEGDIGLEDLR